MFDKMTKLENAKADRCEFFINLHLIQQHDASSGIRT
jgi:hypothetical protein